jgi:CRISPR/Cas system CMR subunit Cmr4 (Cas7 group RAMP superfamily)
MTLKYQLKFYDYWHISSGLSAGARLDSTVIKDNDGLPYVAGKIIKGLSREMAELVGDCTFVNSCFGGSANDVKNGKEKDICYDEKAKNIQGICYFSNATLETTVAEQITTNYLQDNLYDIIASTKIDENGMAETKSLREIEVVVPLTLCGEIRDIPNNEYQEKMTRALKMIKRMGLNRNRGLGRCEFIVKECK